MDMVTPKSQQFILQIGQIAVPNMNRIHEILWAIEWFNNPELKTPVSLYLQNFEVPQDAK